MHVYFCFQRVIAIPDHQADKACGAADSLNARYRPDGHHGTGPTDHRPLGMSQQCSGVFGQDLHYLRWIRKSQVSPVPFCGARGQQRSFFTDVICFV